MFIIVYNKVKLDYFCIIKLLVCRALIPWYINNESHGRKALLEKDTDRVREKAWSACLIKPTAIWPAIK